MILLSSLGLCPQEYNTKRILFWIVSTWFILLPVLQEREQAETKAMFFPLI
jgi:hypothetical protein